jgi:enamine deaminase RidA (YjgF/YER057c/UK114 family)
LRASGATPYVGVERTTTLGGTVALQRINPAALGGARPGMSQGVRVGNLVFLAGAAAVSAQGILVGPGDPARQAEQCFDNIEAVLADAGARLSDLVKLTCYAVDLDSAASYVEVKRRRLGGDAPASTTVLVSGFLFDGMLLEVEATAVIDRS